MPPPLYPIHKAKYNFSRSWLIGFGSYEGGRLWVEDPLGTEPPPCVSSHWQKALRGSYHDVRDTWVQFDPQPYHCVEPVTKGVRRSVALFTPRSWKKSPAHCLDELIEIGLYPPLSAQVAEAEASALPVAVTLLSLPWLTQADKPLLSPWALPTEVMSLTAPDPDEQLQIDSWCQSDLVALPSAALPASDGSMMPLTENEIVELIDPVNSGHVTKSNLCRGCLQSEGPRRIQRSIRDIDKASHALHIDIAGPLPLSDDGFTYFLVGALRLPGLPLLIDVKLLSTRTSTEAFFEALQSEGFNIRESCRIKRLHSDRAGEFTAPFSLDF